MNFLIIYLLSVVAMLLLYWLDRKNYKYQYMTYGEFAICAFWVFFPGLNTVAAVASAIIGLLTADFWNRRPYDGFH